MEDLIADIETDGLLDKVSTVHCIVVQSLSGDEAECYHDAPDITPRAGSVRDGVKRLQGNRIIGQNWEGYDGVVLGRFFPGEYDPGQVVDTAVLSRLVYSDRKERDFALFNQGKLEGRWIGQHSLGAWGARLGFPKGDFKGPWETFTQEMLDYCVRDVAVTERLYRVLWSRRPIYEAAGYTTERLEHAFNKQLLDQEWRGAKVSVPALHKLVDTLERRSVELESVIQAAFPPDYIPYKPYANGQPRLIDCKYRGGKHSTKYVPFDPNSRQQLARRLQRDHAWVPKELSQKTLKPLMQERILLELADVYPVVRDVTEYYIVKQRLGTLRHGANAYLKLLDEKGHMHGRCLHIGTVTHRCAHSKPNLGNVTSTRKPFGLEIRGLFVPRTGMVQAGFDADSLELRMLAHYLAEYDDGAYAEAVHSGSKEDGTDPHSIHARAISTVYPIGRDASKNFTYAFLYGAGDGKLGAMAGGGKGLGRKIRNALKKHVRGLSDLADFLKGCVEAGSLESLDGRRVALRYEHAALNSLLQAAGAVVMRWVPVFLHEELTAAGVTVGRDFIQTGHIHDEVQGSLLPVFKQIFEDCVQLSFSRAQAALGLAVPLVGSASFGNSWKETH